MGGTKDWGWIRWVGFIYLAFLTVCYTLLAGIIGGGSETCSSKWGAERGGV